MKHLMINLSAALIAAWYVPSFAQSTNTDSRSGANSGSTTKDGNKFQTNAPTSTDQMNQKNTRGKKMDMGKSSGSSKADLPKPATTDQDSKSTY